MKYERLTERDEYGNADIIGISTAIMANDLMYDEFIRLTKALNRLAELEDKIENGTLVELPCKVGDTIYYASECVTSVMTFTIVSINIYEEETVFWDDSSNDWHIEDFGKYVFTTKADAEKRLKELRGEV